RCDRSCHLTWLFPTRLVVRNPVGELEVILYPHAAGTERAAALIEQLLHWRIVHIDAELITHIETQEAECVLFTRVLLEFVGRGLCRCPVDGFGVDFRTVDAVVNANALVCQILRLLLQTRYQIERGD